MIRLPKRMVERSSFDPFLRGSLLAETVDSGDNLILDIYDDGDEGEGSRFWDDGSGWLGILAPLRSDLLSGDLRLLYLIWLAAVDNGKLSDDEVEPLPGIGPMTGGLEAFAEFFRIDLDLVQAAAESPVHGAEIGVSSETAQTVIASIPEEEKTEMLHRLAEGDPHVANELRCRIRKAASPTREAMQSGLRTVSGLRSRAATIREQRKAADAEQREVERRRKERKAEEVRRKRLDVLRQRGEAVWSEVESQIAKRNASGYDRATALLFDLKALSEDNGSLALFLDRLHSLQSRHIQKKRFLQRLADLSRPE